MGGSTVLVTIRTLMRMLTASALTVSARTMNVNYNVYNT